MKTLLSAMVLTLMAVAAIASQKAMIVVRPECLISGANCAIGDIAMVQSSDKETTQKLKSLVVCTSPLPGKSRKVPREQIVVALRRGAMSDGTYDLFSPQQVTITRNEGVASGQMIFDAAKEFASTSGSWPGTVVIEASRMPSDQCVPTGKMEMRVPSGTKSARKGQNTIPVEIVVDGRTYRTVQVTVMVKILAKVLVASQAISRADAISATNTSIEERDVTRLADDVMMEAPASDYAASVPIAQGAVIRKQWVSAPPAIKAGDAVIVIVESDGVRVSDKGIAAQDGREGDRIKVRFSGDAREIRGTVAEPGVVKISLGRRTNQ